MSRPAHTEELQARRADAGGNSYNAACYAEGRQLARDFLQRLAARHPALAAPLQQAAADYTVAAAAMARVAALFPFPGQWGAVAEDAPAIEKAAAALREAREAESRAVDRLAGVAGRD